MNTQFSSFPYRTLKEHEIRLITIEPGEFQSSIKLVVSHIELRASESADGTSAHLHHGDANGPSNAASLGGPFDFEALSYCWGRQPPTVPVSLNGISFRVSPSLESILRYVRNPDAQRSIWVDAICINQRDDEEKMSQIPKMHEIYSQARRVIVWLGDPTTETDLAMQYIRNVHAPVEKGKEDQISDVVALKNWPLRFLSTAPLSLTDIASLVAFYKFLRQPWWYRAWIVQEMGLARALNMQCGKETVTFSQMKAALQITRRIHPAFILYTDVVKRSIAEDRSLEADWPSDAINNALNLEYCRRMILERDARTDSNGHPPAEQVSWSFWSTRARLCKTPHDRAFSLLGIAGKDFRQYFASRYEDAPEEHYRNTIRGFVDATDSLDLMLHSQHSIWLPHSSSWAPDWGQPERAGVFHLNRQTLEEPLALHKGDVSIPRGSDKLLVRGRVLGTLSRTKLEVGRLVRADAHADAGTMPVTASAGEGASASPRRRWWLFRPEFENGQLFRDALARRLPSSDPLWTKHLELFLIAFADVFCANASAVLPERWRNRAGPLPEEDRFQELEQFWDLLEYLLIGRTICEMDDGRLVVAPDFSEAGDVVALLAGCSNAVVLRSRENERAFSFLGDAWVLGIGRVGDGKKFVDFEIR